MTAESLAQVLDRRGGSNSDICCCLMDVKEFDSWEGCENCLQYFLHVCSGVRLPKMLWSGLRNMSRGIKMVES
jgi:hypothetical protein